jgi:two-component system C4-dicarboxylate transport sensor histidine kinase DctB
VGTDFALLAAANRTAVYGVVGRWLMHDLRNPAQAVTLVTELVRDGEDPADPMLQTTLRDAAAHLARSVRLLDRVLRLPPRNPSAGPVALGDVIDFLVEVHETRKSRVELDPRGVAAGLPAVAAIEDSLEHALLNLVVNADEALAERDGGRIALTAEARGNWVELRVEDTGPGVDAAVAGRLFEPFTTTKRGRPHAGLGLAVARGLLAQFGGTVALEPAAAGACFLVTLPVWRR